MQADMLRGLGFKHPNRIDDIFDPPRPPRSTVNRVGTVAAMGGDVG